MNKHLRYLSCWLLLALAASTGCAKQDPGKYVYATLITVAVEEGQKTEIESGSYVEHDIQIRIVAEPMFSRSPAFFHWTNRIANESDPESSYSQFLNECNDELEQRCGVILPVLEGVAPADFESLLEKAMNDGGFHSIVSGSKNQSKDYSTSHLNKIRHHKVRNLVYERR